MYVWPFFNIMHERVGGRGGVTSFLEQKLLLSVERFRNFSWVKVFDKIFWYHFRNLKLENWKIHANESSIFLYYPQFTDNLSPE